MYEHLLWISFNKYYNIKEFGDKNLKQIKTRWIIVINELCWKVNNVFYYTDKRK